MAHWIQESPGKRLVQEGLIYPLKTTAIRGNFQVSLSTFERMQKAGHPFFVVIHDGKRTAYFIPDSVFAEKVAARAQARTRATGARLFIGYPLTGQTHVLSFGPDASGQQVSLDVRPFLNVFSGPEELASGMQSDVSVACPFVPGEGPYILDDQQFLEITGHPLRELEGDNNQPFLRSWRDEGFTWTMRPGADHDELIVEHKNDTVASQEYEAIMEDILLLGAADTSHLTKPAAWRPYQRALRRVLMQTYSGCCAFCDVDVPALLAASHIVPASEDRTLRANAANAILLCRLHDGAFDRFLLSVEPQDRVLRTSPRFSTASQVLLREIKGRDGSPMRGPSVHPPLSSSLDWHFSRSQRT